ncbi:hypothetical protein SAMN02745857_00540 [Andreprevotia lacus DSM 23236]|jgi:tetratricopeptide (TPR) repeat protein|uniref:Uncharacterized protein n=1 Tax=Andreprevotia lacus DSM 23236 TaxID=1121001 RepID=A0A1W1X4I4_9NEIS|nr:hypothetical protein [Andreprevotia lacus]SMC18351.1 hypothetical protein SAMN02745857_00540 [Andreprevotia lacus DSM 23236]
MPDTSALGGLIEESERLTYLDPHRALSLAEEASRLAATSADPVLASRAWRRYGSLLLAFGRIPDGQQAMLNALKIAEAEDIEFERGEIIQEIASIYYTLGEYGEAIAYWGDCLDETHNAGFVLSTRIHAHIGLGQVYFAHESFQMALAHHLQAQSLCTDELHVDLRARVAINLTADYYKLHRYNDALAALSLAEPLSVEAGNQEYLGEILVYRCHIALDLGQLAAAHEYLAGAEALRRVWVWGEVSQQITRGRLAMAEGDLAEARRCFAGALARAEDMGSAHEVYQANHLLAQASQLAGDVADAERYHRRYQEVFNRIVRPATFAQLRALEARLKR